MNLKPTIIKKVIHQKCKPFILCLLLISTILMLSSCERMIEAPPPTESVSESNAYSVDATAIAVLNNLYISMNGGSFQGNSSISLFSGLSSDELTLHSGIAVSNYISYYQNKLSAILKTGSNFWAPLYSHAFKCNAAIEGLNKSTSLTAAIKQQLLGEAKFMRAFVYFYLVNLFGDIPLALTTDPEVNTLLTRSPKDIIYQQIIEDLLDAEENLSPVYLDGTLLNATTERVRPTKWAAESLLARVYLYSGNWAKAEEKASLVINNKTLFGPLLSIPLNKVFLKNSSEAIWQLQPTAINFNTAEAQTLIIPQSGPSTGGATSNPVYLSRILLSSFEANDQRKVYGNWVDTTIYKITSTTSDTVTYPYKYKINISNTSINNTTGTQLMTEYYMVLRLAEQYLIRAEARAQLENISGAKEDLNTIRNRAGLGNTTAGDKNSLLMSILHERQVELFSEWGHRWLDLKRTGNLDAVMSVVTPQKANGDPWLPYQALYPLPLTELQAAPNIAQNMGY